MSKIEIVIERILKREGGFVIDHAGPTNFGITIPPYKEFTRKDVDENTIRNMTKEEAIEFYKWLLNKERVAEISNLDTMDILFDAMVNHGNRTAIQWAQRVCKVKDDGILGDITLSSINNNSKAVYYGILVERIKLYTHLSVSNPNKYQKYLKGWIDRACKFIKEI